ncbi:MAG: tRNA dihydrouridine synthase DusB [Alphaproteobacteria bacterium]
MQIGPHALNDPVILAPMSGITDAPFRRLVRRHGVGMTVTEMIAGAAQLRHSPLATERVRRDADERPFVIQLVGCRPEDMGEAARHAVRCGADIVDINMGCPARKVVGGEAGSALMRDEDSAARIIDAVVRGAGEVPVTLKMRTGWDADNRNAPHLAARAEALGVQAVTVHGRTRAQRFEGRADWRFIAEVKAAVSIPVIANGDLSEIGDATAMLRQSGADAVMVGRAARGRPWFCAQVADALAGRPVRQAPDLAMRRDLALEHYEAMLAHYGVERGRRMARKHLDWSMADAGIPGDARHAVKTADDPGAVRRLLADAFARAGEREAA